MGTGVDVLSQAEDAEVRALKAKDFLTRTGWDFGFGGHKHYTAVYIGQTYCTLISDCQHSR